MRAQGVCNPKSVFYNHFVIRAALNGSNVSLYDPSYGAGPYVNEDALVGAMSGIKADYGGAGPDNDRSYVRRVGQ